MYSKTLKPLIQKLTIFAKDRLNFKRPPRLFLRSDNDNANCSLGKTGHYDPAEKSITLFITNRHPKDILRSFAHELVHHCQNERGDLSSEKMKSMHKNYAQENPHMRKMEEEAYLQGNMCFRDWEDSMDNKLKYKISVAEQKFLKENKKMSVKITKNQLKGLIEKLLEENLKGKAEPSLKNKFQAALKKRSRVEQASNAIAENEVETDDLEESTCGGKREDKKKKKKKYMEEEKCPKCDDGSCKDCKNKAKLKEELEEGDIPQGLKDYMDKKKKKEPAGKTSQDAPMSVPADDDDPPAKEGEKPDIGDIDGDDNREESAKGAAKDKEAKERQEESKIRTPEQENTLYESRFAQRNTRLFEKLLKEWTK